MPRLGQHFLVHKKILSCMVRGLNLAGEDLVIEIGAGHGELTFLLGDTCNAIGCKVIAIEKDPRLSAALKKSAESAGQRFLVMEGDVRDLLPRIVSRHTRTGHLPALQKTHRSTYALTGNIPYYLTGQLFRLITLQEEKPSRVVWMLQKEVAERVAAAPPRMNKLAGVIQYWFTPELLGTVSRKYFHPVPDVDSALLSLILKNERGENFVSYETALRILFRQPRKTVLNNLLAMYPKEKRDARENARALIEEKLLLLGIQPTARPANLSLEDIARIANTLQ